ncbi:MAG TPA: NADP-dependent oxidoreductase [Burkholderiales bacterium]|nr:NADP-dependent oxidoreductase [Burkholderiales bacterium]
MNCMRFSRFGPPEVLGLHEIPTPRPGPGEVLIAIEAASVTPGDAKLRAGLLQELFPVSLPCIPGRDGAGRVAALGTAVDYARSGEPVCFVAQRTVQGSYATHIVRDARSVVGLPDTMSFAEGAALMHAGTCAWIALVGTASLERGQKLLVHGGSGAIGGMAVQLAKHLGVRVSATCSARNTDYVQSLGADEVIAYDREPFWEGRGGFDMVLDLVGGRTHERSYPLLRKGGTLVWLIAQPFKDRSAEFGVRTLQARIVDSPRANAAVVALAAKGVIKAQVSSRMPLREAAEAHRRVEGGRASRGRIVLDTRES